MKKILFAAILVLTTAFFVTTAEAQCAPSGTYYSLKGAFPIYYGTTLTITNTGSDTIDMGLPCTPKSITFTNDILKVSGTPAGTVALYGSANGGITYDPTPITSYSVTASSTTVPQTKVIVINSGINNPYTNYRWIYPGTGTMVATMKSYVLVR